MLNNPTENEIILEGIVRIEMVLPNYYLKYFDESRETGKFKIILTNPKEGAFQKAYKVIRLDKKDEEFVIKAFKDPAEQERC